MNTLPTAQTMYRALVDRDSQFEGLFYVAVRTTGVFCRPTCPARKPRPENVEYFSSPQEALHHGYRPCSRCRPMDKQQGPPELAYRLLDLVERAPAQRLSDQDLQDMNIDPSTARRQFKRYYGMTVHAYHRARRMGLALREVRKGKPVITAQVENGFESASGFWDAFKRVFGAPPSRSDQITCLLARWIESPLGPMVALANRDGLHLLEFIDRRGLENELIWIRKRAKKAVVPGNNSHLEQTAEELKNYFDGTAMEFTVPLVMIGSDFERRVWDLLRGIPAGETRSYSDLARRLGSPAAVRAVGRANGRNPLCLIVPCHRVIGADGNLVGYGGGLWRKKWLLDHERRFAGTAEPMLPLEAGITVLR
jgi:AraC family transcriptional regulator of adaptative response/methylated-DNA-[protein]-cysteine methyltransferase